MKFYIGYDHEGFEKAAAETIVPALSLVHAVDYAVNELIKGLISSFQVYTEKGDLVFDSTEGVAA